MRVVERIVALLEALSDTPTGLGVVKLAEKLAVPPPTIHRLLAVLVKHRLVMQDPDSRRYRLGPGVLSLSDAYVLHNSLARVGQPLLDHLGAELEESVFITEYVAGQAICVATADNRSPLRYFMRVGHRMPYHAAASARAILAFQPLVEAERLLKEESFERFTPSTLSSPAAVMAELRRVRAQGYATCDEELERGVAAISVPIRDRGEDVIASLSVVGPQPRLAGPNQDRILTVLLKEAELISRELGHRGAQPGESAVVA